MLVPYWRALPPREFLDWYARHGPLLVRFYAPLEIVGTVLVSAAALMAFLDAAPGRGLLALAALLSVAVLASFPLYFQKANARFATGSLDAEHVAGELERWARWHRARTWIAIAAATVAAGALRAA